MALPVAPFVRPLYGPKDPRHTKAGHDVVAVKRGLSRAGYLKWGSFTNGYGQQAVDAVKRFQRAHRIQPTGHYGYATHEALRRTRRKDHRNEWAFDAPARELLRLAYRDFHTTPQDRARQAGISAASFWIVHRDQTDYAQVRPIRLCKPPVIPPQMDCSWFVIDVYWAAGCPDPTGRGYDGEGYTGSLVDRGQRVSTPEPMDLVFYGFTHNTSPAFPYGSPTHVALYIGGGYVASDGSNSGPQKLALNYRSDLHSIRRYPLA